MCIFFSLWQWQTLGQCSFFIFFIIYILLKEFFFFILWVFVFAVGISSCSLYYALPFATSLSIPMLAFLYQQPFFFILFFIQYLHMYVCTNRRGHRLPSGDSHFLFFLAVLKCKFIEAPNNASKLLFFIILFWLFIAINNNKFNKLNSC